MTQQTLQIRASIEIPTTLPDSLIDSFEVKDNFGAYSREFTIHSTGIANFQVNNEIIVNAGYDANRVKLIDGRIDEITAIRSPNSNLYSLTGRDFGAKQLDSVRITKVYISKPTTITPFAHQIIADTAAAVGLTVGFIEFPDYPLYNNFVMIGRTLIETIEELAAPWNIFKRIQYVAQIRDKVLNVIKIDWQNPPSGGCQIQQKHLTQIEQRQVAYLEEPRLNEVQFIIIRGAAYTRPLTDLGAFTRIEYQRQVLPLQVVSGLFGDSTNYVTQETVTTEIVWGDKVLMREEKKYSSDASAPDFAGTLIERSLETFVYYEPPPEDPNPALVPSYDGSNAAITSFASLMGGIGFGSVFGNASQLPEQIIPWYHTAPSGNALLSQTLSRRWGLVQHQSTGGPFYELDEIFRGITTYHYDNRNQIAQEINITQEFSTTDLKWEITKLAIHSHTALTSGATRTQLSQFQYDRSKFTLSTVDVQIVGGSRADLNHPSSRRAVFTVQAQSPQGEQNALGQAIDFGQDRFFWQYENPYIPQAVCDTLYQNALTEQTFQLSGAKWDSVHFQSTVNPGLYVGKPVSIEITPGVFRDYWIEEINHTGTPNSAISSGTAKRLTTEDLT